MARYLNIDKANITCFLSVIGSSNYCSISEIQTQNKESRIEIYVNMEGAPDFIRFSSLSDSQQMRVIIELGVAFAEFESRGVPVVLMVDLDSFNFDPDWYTRYLDWISRLELNIQVIFTSVHLERYKENKCKILEIVGTRPNQIIQTFKFRNN